MYLCQRRRCDDEEKGLIVEETVHAHQFEKRAAEFRGGTTGSATHDSQISALAGAYQELHAKARALNAIIGAFASHVEVAQGPTRRVQTDRGGEPTKIELSAIADGAEVIEFGPGVYRLSWRRTWTDSIERLLIRGAGMEQTTLIAGDLFTMGGELRHFRMQDLTFQGQALGVRGKAAAIFERVRFQEWATGSGYGAPVGSAGEVYVGFHDCEFLGSGNGQALAVRGDSIALFDGCVFYRLPFCVTPWGTAFRQARFPSCH